MYFPKFTCFSELLNHGLSHISKDMVMLVLAVIATSDWVKNVLIIFSRSEEKTEPSVLANCFHLSSAGCTFFPCDRLIRLSSSFAIGLQY